MAKPKVYISGPMHGKPDYNWEAFHRAATQLKIMGFDVVNPHDLDDDPNLPACHTREEYYRRDMKVLPDCDMIVTIEGWQESTGAKLEVFVASQIAMPIFYLEEWIQHGTAVGIPHLCPLATWQIPRLEFPPEPAVSAFTGD